MRSSAAFVEVAGEREEEDYRVPNRSEVVVLILLRRLNPYRLDSMVTHEYNEKECHCSRLSCISVAQKGVSTRKLDSAPWHSRPNENGNGDTTPKKGRWQVKFQAPSQETRNKKQMEDTRNQGWLQKIRAGVGVISHGHHGQ
jgi:hypothetical protein